MEELIDLIATDSSASSVSDKIKELLYSKAAERIEAAKPIVADFVFNSQDSQEDSVEEN